MNRIASSLVVSTGFALSAAQAQTCGNPWSPGATGPDARYWHAATYDSVRGKVVVFGGRNLSSTIFSDTWEWTAAGPGGGGSWVQRPEPGPGARYSAGLAYDSSRHRTVLFGGLISSSSARNQTWEWDGAAWTLMQPAASPPAMDGSLLAYDSSRQRIVLVGRLNSSAGGTWEYDGQTWALQGDVTPLPAPGYWFGIAFDVSRSRMVLVGPIVAQGSQYGIGVWERDASGWTLLDQGTFPYSYYTTPRCAYDPGRGRMLVVDPDLSANSTQVWAWSGSSWSRLPGNGAVPLQSFSAAFDAAGDQLVTFGGYPYSGTPSNRVDLYRPGLRSGPELSDLGVRSLNLALARPPAVLRVSAFGTGTITYQWRLNGIELFNGGGFSGVTTPELTIDPNDGAHSGTYDAVVTDSCGQTIRPGTNVLISCYANCDGSSVMPRLNAEDFQCFLNMYASSLALPVGQQITSYANCDGSTYPPVLNANDFQCFLNQFSIGCP